MSPGRAYDRTDGKAGEDKVMSSGRAADIDVMLHGKDMTAHTMIQLELDKNSLLSDREHNT